jgi:cytoskeleton protein RodZ
MADAQRLALDGRDDFENPILDQREICADRNLSLQTLGQDLCETREHKGITPEIIWRDLKIAPHHLTAIENSRFAALPGRVYAVGFVRSYARYLGLDVERCVTRLKAEMAGPDIKPPLIRPSSQVERKDQFEAAPAESVNAREPESGLFSPRKRVEISPERSAQQYFVIGLIIAVLVYGGYNIFSSARLMTPSPVIPVPARLAAEAGLPPKKSSAPAVAMRGQTARIAHALAPTASAEISLSHPTGAPLASIEPIAALAPDPNRIPAIDSASTHPVSVGPLATPTLPPESTGATSTERAPPKQPLPSVSEQTLRFRPPLPLGARYGMENANSRVVLRLHRSIRIAVKGGRNRIFIDRMLGAGATYRVPNTPGVKLSVPDAGAVEVILDGNTVGFAGKDGVAARELGLDQPSIIRRYHW